MKGERGSLAGLPLFCAMSAIKDGRYPVTLGGKLRHLLFDLNVLDEMQDKFGGFDTLADILNGEHSMKNMKWLLALLINEGKEENEPDIDERQVGRFLHVGNMQEVMQHVYKAFALGNAGDEETTSETLAEDETDEADEAAEDGEEKNAEPGKED